ncbi:MAG: hypothetical protein EPN97_05035 [Alphaproteobacteria bacterium]|nr:MAG: hypothetical protein EPN97_05035 [Alphaproteobacteria bacterium]
MYKPRRPPHSTDKTQPDGNALRDALARRRADEDSQEQQREQDARDALGGSLSKWFNDVAADIPKKVAEITRALDAGQSVSADFSYSASEASLTLRGLGEVNMETLPGFKKLDETCKGLDIACTVTQGRNGYGRKVGAGQPYLHVTVDAEKPYRPVTVEKVQPRGRR